MTKETIEQVLKFRDERNWKQFHNPKDLAISICLEAAELLEVFQWSADEVWCEEKKDKIGEELADVLNYCILMADTCGLDMDEIIQEKVRKNAEKYPVEKAYGHKKIYRAGRIIRGCYILIFWILIIFWEQIDEAFQFVLRNIHLGAAIVGIYRQDVYEIPPDAIRELIINAMVHRSYLDHGTIQVAVYDNRLEITSPGKLPMGQTMERMKEGYSKIRNEALAHAFAYMNLIEHWGSGIPRIIDKVKAAGLREPEFIGGEVDLRINIYRGQIDGTVDLNAPNTAVKPPLNRRETADKVPANEQEQQIYKYVSENVGITTAQAMKLLGIKQRRTREILG